MIEVHFDAWAAFYDNETVVSAGVLVSVPN